MVAKESVRARMEDREAGISYTEFSYMLLQAFDFYVLCRDYNCELQIGGSDQWGNITAGIDLTRKKLGRTVYGLTLPLITNADGTQVRQDASAAPSGSIPAAPASTGSTSSGSGPTTATSIRYLKFFTFLSQEEIAALEKQHAENPGARAAHKALAKAVTDLVHGPSATAEAMRASEILFGGDLAGISEATFNEIVGEVPTKEIGEGRPRRRRQAAGRTAGAQRPLPVQGPGAQGHRRRRRLREQRPRGRASSAPSPPSDLLFGKHLLLRKGKRNYVVLTAK